MGNRLHIVGHDKGWAIKEEGIDAVESVHGTQKEALSEAHTLADEREVDIVVHRRDGTFRKVVSPAEMNGNGANSGSSTSNETVRKEVVETGTSPLSRMSWGAVVAGIFFAIASSWLMLVLGTSIGISVLDATDSTILEGGLTTWSIVWLVLTAFVAFFVGGLFTARLANNEDGLLGMLHGITLWSVTTVCMLLVSYWGIADLTGAGASALQSTASVAQSATSTASGAVTESGKALAWAGDQFAETQLAGQIQNELNQELAVAAAELDPKGGEDINPQEIKNAISSLDAELMENLATSLVQGNDGEARQTLAANTDLSDAQIGELIAGISNKIEESDAPEMVQKKLNQSVDQIAKSASQIGPSVEQQEVRKAIQEMDAETIQSVSMHLINGKPEAAKMELATSTPLEPKDVNKIVDHAQSKFQKQVEEFQSEANAVLATVTDYTQTVLWTTFGCSAMALLFAISGGMLGADLTQKQSHRVIVREQTA